MSAAPQRKALFPSKTTPPPAAAVKSGGAASGDEYTELGHGWVIFVALSIDPVVTAQMETGAPSFRPAEARSLPESPSSILGIAASLFSVVDEVSTPPGARVTGAVYVLVCLKATWILTLVLAVLSSDVTASLASTDGGGSALKVITIRVPAKEKM